MNNDCNRVVVEKVPQKNVVPIDRDWIPSTMTTVTAKNFEFVEIRLVRSIMNIRALLDQRTDVPHQPTKNLPPNLEDERKNSSGGNKNSIHCSSSFPQNNQPTLQRTKANQPREELDEDKIQNDRRDQGGGPNGPTTSIGILCHGRRFRSDH